MKVALCAYDFFSPVISALDKANVDVGHVWSFEVDNQTDSFNLETETFARQRGAKFSLAPINAADIAMLEKSGTDLLLVAGYKYKVPIPNKSPLYFVNTHGTLLPEGRGPWPQPWILLKYPQFAGVTLHQMTNKWDHGDIIIQKRIVVDLADDITSLSCKTAALAGELVTEFLSNAAQFWSNRISINEKGSYWRLPQETERTVDPTMSIEDITRVHRAFGNYTLYFDKNSGRNMSTTEMRLWPSDHSFPPGWLVAKSNRQRLFAINGGFVCFNIISGN